MARRLLISKKTLEEVCYSKFLFTVNFLRLVSLQPIDAIRDLLLQLVIIE